MSGENRGVESSSLQRETVEGRGYIIAKPFFSILSNSLFDVYTVSSPDSLFSASLFHSLSFAILRPVSSFAFYVLVCPQLQN